MTLEALKNFGANTQEGMARCMNNEAFYLRLVGMLSKDTNVEKLSQALLANDLNAAFEAAHALKGSLSNLAITPVLEPVVEITEHLRARESMDYMPLMQKIQDNWDGLMKLL
ncbi:MAG: Hpt domain-containing protein [Clostridia bacterium]|nr:Hpt domain-containing protein [Clostridia bacterium]